MRIWNCRLITVDAGFHPLYEPATLQPSPAFLKETHPLAKRAKKPSKNGANLGFEATLWAAADKLRNNMDAAEYKHVVVGLIFLKYISDAFEERHQTLLSQKAEGADPEDPDEYRSENIFWVPKEARWEHLRASAKQPTIGKTVDDAMVAIERDNKQLKGVLPKEYARQGLDKTRLGELIDLISKIGLVEREHRSKDILGRVYEYFLSQFASAEGKKGGQFYTLKSVVRVLVDMLEPYKGWVFDPCCRSGVMFVQSSRLVANHHKNSTERRRLRRREDRQERAWRTSLAVIP
jgi:type I restriction enzyme M protein